MSLIDDKKNNIKENDLNTGGDDYYKELFSIKFLTFILITFIKNSSGTLMVNNFKYMADRII